MKREENGVTQFITSMYMGTTTNKLTTSTYYETTYLL